MCEILYFFPFIRIGQYCKQNNHNDIHQFMLYFPPLSCIVYPLCFLLPSPSRTILISICYLGAFLLPFSRVWREGWHFMGQPGRVYGTSCN